MPACVHGDMIISVSTMDGANTPEMKMATAFVKCMSIRWKGSGRSCGVGCARIGAFLKRNSPCTSVSLSLCTTSDSEAKRCCMRSLSYWSHKTLESNMSVDNLSGSNPHQGVHTGLHEQGDMSIGRQAPIRHEHVPGLQEGMYLLDAG